MIGRKYLTRKLLSLLLSLLVTVSCLPFAMVSVNAADNGVIKVSDPSTMDGWKDFFTPDDGSFSTENAGGIWTNKSVFSELSPLFGAKISGESNNSFIVALSAMASNMTVDGMSSLPSDTIFVLDASSYVSVSDNKALSDLVDSVNLSLFELQKNNKDNRVGVVLYSKADGLDSAELLLPLDRYATDEDNSYISYSCDFEDGKAFESVSLDKAVISESTGKAPVPKDKSVAGYNYIQSGVGLAAQEFTATDLDTTVEDPVLGTLNRKPVMVLVSAGDPLYATSEFENPKTPNLGNGTVSAAAMGFVSQLTNSYSKYIIEEKYHSDCLIYTVGVGIEDSSIAESILNPEETSTAINAYWNRYNGATVGNYILIQTASGDNEEVYVKKNRFALNQQCVDRYFHSDIHTESISDTFDAVVSEINLKSAYYPTLVSGNENFSGYVSFVDRVGEYMEVKNIKGILTENGLFSGADLASNFVENGSGLGSIEKPTTLGDELVWAIQSRLGLATAAQARSIVSLAYAHGQLSYNSPSDFSNYIGWYANAKGEFLGFWYEGTTTMPDPDDSSLNDDTRPAYIIKSYYYLGEAEGTVAKSDLLYAVIQVRESIKTGEQAVTFGVPAALMPVVTYGVSYDDSGEVTDITVSGAESPIRLLYEVGLKQGISSYSINNVVSVEYLSQNTNSDGSVNFYTNQFENDGGTGYNKLNPYSYFRPSRHNSRYYYQSDALIYTDTQGTPYKGDSQPEGEMYHSYPVYKKNGNKVTTETVYHKLSGDTLPSALRNADGTWYIPEGTARRDYEGYIREKTENKSGTLSFSAAPFMDTGGHSLDELDYEFVYGATLGNNGRLTLTPETGFKLSARLSGAQLGADDEFSYVITNETNKKTAEHDYHMHCSDGNNREGKLTFQNGVTKVSLKANEELFIGGFAEGDVISIKALPDEKYIVKSVNADETLKDISLTVKDSEISDASFVFGARGIGNFTVSSVIAHPFGTDYVIPEDISFEIEVTFDGDTASKTYDAMMTGSDLTSVTTDENGKFTVKMGVDEQLEVIGLPEGIKATVKQKTQLDGFTVNYYDKGLLDDGEVVIESDKIVSVIVNNTYAPAPAEPMKLNVFGNVNLEGREWSVDDSFDLELQKWERDSRIWKTLSKATVSGEYADKAFDFGAVLENEEFSEAKSYYYRVVQIEPAGKISGVSYDKTVHSFSVDVTDLDMNGKLEITGITAYRSDSTEITKTKDGYDIKVSFINSYDPKGDTVVTIDINKFVVNESESNLASPLGFVFGLYDTEGNLIQTSRKTTDRGFTRMVIRNLFEEVGTYQLILREHELENAQACWEYSQIEIPVTVEVMCDENGTYSAIIYCEGEDRNEATSSISVEFVNKYVPVPAELDIDFVDLKLEGRNTPLEEGEFTFCVENLEGEALVTGTNTAEGKVVFDSVMSFSKVGVYYFHVVEASEESKGIKTDENIYRIIVNVSDVGGKLKANYELVNAAGFDITFKNLYVPNPVKYSLKAEKILTGRELMNDEFTFSMTRLDEAGKVVEDIPTLYASNNSEGHIVFPEIEFTSAGVYFYDIAEVNTRGEGGAIVYDENIYRAVITVSDNNEGDLAVETVELKGTDELVFENKYVPSPVKAKLEGSVFITGRTQQEGEFSFEVYKANSDWTEGDLLFTAFNNVKGKILFDSMTFTQAGEYNYIVKQKNAGKTIDGTVYDEISYRVQITVKDNLRGTLSASVLYMDSQSTPYERMEFFNLYTPEYTDITVDINIENIINNKGTESITPEGFAFLLTGENGEKFTASTGQNGKGKITLMFTQNDAGKTFTYTLKEINDGRDNVTYSDRVYTVEISIGLDSSKKLLADLKLDGKDVKEINAKFENVYDYTPQGTLIPDVPETGDFATYVLWLAISLLFVSAYVSLVLRAKRKEG